MAERRGGGGGCCIARYAGSAYSNTPSKVDRIMLKFRPIAPKPSTGMAVSGGSTVEKGDVYVKTGRCKRKYVRDATRKYTNKKRKSSPAEETDSNNSKSCSGGSVSGGGETVVTTLPLLPGIPDRKESLSTNTREKNIPIWLNFSQNNSGTRHVAAGGGKDRTVVMTPQPVRMVGSCVTVEHVDNNTWVDADVDVDGLGGTDEERLLNLKRDTCPGFVSDEYNRVCWANKAYKEMMGEVVVEGGGEMVVVWLVMKECVTLPVNVPAFTCRVKVTCGKGKSSSLILPCDVWRMDGGGFAWRLDVKAALSLGR